VSLLVLLCYVLSVIGNLQLTVDVALSAEKQKIERIRIATSQCDLCNFATQIKKKKKIESGRSWRVYKTILLEKQKCEVL
jgi:hypothetical protein